MQMLNFIDAKEYPETPGRKENPVSIAAEGAYAIGLYME